MIAVPVPVVTAVVVSPPAARTPTTPPAGVVTFAPSAPKVSAVLSDSTLPVAVVLSLTDLMLAVAVGPSYVMLTVTVLLTALPKLSLAT